MKNKLLYSHDQAKDSCGFGLIAQIDNQPSHGILQKAIKSLARMTHRGAVSADGLTGDGCGVLIKKPDDFLQKVCAELSIRLAKQYAVGSIFLSTDTEKKANARLVVEKCINQQGLSVAGWRDVPVNTTVLGTIAKSCLPHICQIFINDINGITVAELERKLYLARIEIRNILKDDEDFYICSLSSHTLIYKGLMLPANLAQFYLDLADPTMKTSLAIFHQRFSTNTAPKWKLAQPFRMLAHNGEINTINSNRSWAKVRQHKIIGEHFPELVGMDDLVNQRGSDSSSLDNMLDLLVSGGMSITRAIRLLIPPAWQNVQHLDPDLRAFYEYNSMHMEPWDGPAGIVLTDGRYAGCTLDRNGLRPARYLITQSREILIASENGTCDIAEEEVIEKGRIGAGDLFLIDLQEGKIINADEVNRILSKGYPYRRWLKGHTHKLKSIYQQEAPVAEPMTKRKRKVYEKLFNLTTEERDTIIRGMAEGGQEPIGSMGDDARIAILTDKPRPFYDYFKQIFAQVTNPPIDPLREAMVMSLQCCLGAEYSLFQETESQAERIITNSPIITEGQFATLKKLNQDRYGHVTLDLNYDLNEGLENAIHALCQQAKLEVERGVVLLILSDREVAENKLPIHAMLATGALHQFLTEHNMRARVNIVVETATARDPHHMACLLGVGATLIYPYLGFEIIGQLVREKMLVGVTPVNALSNYRKAIDKGLYKIMSKMGISTVTSYRGSQLFEVLGMGDTVKNLAFAKMGSRMGGMNFGQVEQEQKKCHANAFDTSVAVPVGGIMRYMNLGEYHCYNPDVVQYLQKMVKSGDHNDYVTYRDAVNNRPASNIRDLLTLQKINKVIDIDEVEPVESLYKRFDSAAMSLGALSPEAHETLAQAMNELGGRSNSGEGGEDQARYGTNRVSKIKQIASGRFGVTPHYLINAEVLQIKVAQGAKPGEGGQLPGHKVNDLIAELRYSKPGVTLISPPPHHDIYSIEDLAQLIFDLKQVNPKALVSVKLVSEPGVGTIATGVAKAYADLITISGYDGGTGASPLSSIRYAGSPWELGLAETHQALLENDLRDKVIVQTDGGLKTGLDVVKAAILGAESFGFGTGPMIAMGCKYLRICHLNNCATGIATQHELLRQHHYVGTKERVQNYFHFVAEEVREILASLGEKNLQDIVGKTELLSEIETLSEKQRGIDLSPLLGKPEAKMQRGYTDKIKNVPLDKGQLNAQIVADFSEAVDKNQSKEASYPVQNIDRSLGATLSGRVAKKYGKFGMKESVVTLKFTGTAGQSFGVWNAGGVRLELTGEANDYAGKGMSGGRIVIKPVETAPFDKHTAPIVGNTCLYGATGGTFFASGRVGERFAVRNSGAIAVIEGAGSHCCEYMTGGVVVVLGETGLNFGAGMTGGFAFVLDEDNQFYERCNMQSVDLHRISTMDMIEYRDQLEQLISQFATETGSEYAHKIIEDFSAYVSKFWLVKAKSEEMKNLITLFTQAA